jgi:hypothetical protein
MPVLISLGDAGGRMLVFTTVGRLRRGRIIGIFLERLDYFVDSY